MKKFLLTSALLATYALASGADYEFPLDETSWTAVPGWTPGSLAEVYSHSFENGIATFRTRGGGRTMIWARHFKPLLDIRKLRFLTIRYRCLNIDPELRSYFLFLSPAGDGRMTSERLVLAASHLILDGKWHVMTTQLKIGNTLAAAVIRFQALEGQEGMVEISHLSLTARRPRFTLAQSISWSSAPFPAGAQPISLALTFNENLPDLQKALALTDGFTDEKILAAGIPFEVSRDGKMAVATPVKQKTAVTIAAGVRAHSIWLLMGSQFSTRILTYNAWQPGDSIDQPERFSIQTIYEDGTSEDQLPYCVDMKEHAIWRGLHVYEIALLDKRVREIRVRDGMLTSGFHLLALTAGDRSFAPEFPIQKIVPEPATVHAGIVPGTRTEEKELVLSNGAGLLRVRWADGLSITGLTGQMGAPWRIQAVPVPLLSLVRDGEGFDSRAFRWRAESRGAANSVLLGECLKAQMEARILIEARLGNEFAFSLAIRNRSDQTTSASVVFPQVKLSLKNDSEALWYFLPRSCGIVNNAGRMFRTAYGGKFPLQWMDFYDAQTGGGVYVSTRTQSVQHRWYEGGKKEGVGIARIEYLDNVPLPPGKWVEYPQTVVGLHSGDWHEAFEKDRAWRRTWAQPQKPRLDWFRRVSHLRTHWVRTMSSRGKVGLAEYNWMDPNTKKLRPLEFVKKDLRLFGPVDYIHLFDWRISDKFGRWGDYSHYEEIGGLDAFRQAIQKVQARKISVGLYLDTYLCSRKSIIGSRHGRQWAAANQTGRLWDGYSTKDDPMFNMCVSHPGWQDYLAKTCARVARETGCRGIYLDEGGLDLPGYWCWRKDHGHPVPASVIAGQRVLFEKVKAALPDSVALYTEYAPPDALIPHLDGAYMASLRTTELKWSPGYINISRFAFPDFKIFVIANGGSMYDGIYDGLKYSLFNGIALYSLGWGHDREAYALCARISRILKNHEQAFLGLKPRPLIPTELPGIYANEFPGPNETVWTLWSSRFRTAKGLMIRVPHTKGARYRDVWNQKPLTPDIVNGQALIKLEIGPRDIGVFIQAR